MQQKHHEEGLIRPRKGKKDPHVGPDVLMVMVPADLEYLVTVTRARRLSPSGLGFSNLYQTNSDTGEPIALTGPYLGAPQAVMGMEKMIALGAKRIWIMGYCGSLQPDLRIGDLVIPTRAISEEGTSPHYPIGERRPVADTGLNELLQGVLRKAGQSFRPGTVWTTDAPYRETPQKVKAYQERDVLAVEMEMSALMTLALYRMVRMAGLLVVSDELFDVKWNPGFRSPQVKEAARGAGHLLLHAVKSTNG